MRRDRSELWFAALNACGFGGALVALAAGAPVHRLRAVAVFCGVGVTGALYVELARALMRRRARAQSNAPVPRGGWLRKPIWIAAVEGASFVTIATPFAAIAGGAGFASVGVGILLTIVALTIVVSILSTAFGVRGLAFEDAGLRVQVRGAIFLVRWEDIVDVTLEGDAGQSLCVRFTGLRVVVDSVTPATKLARSRAASAIGASRGPTGMLTLSSWTAGLDGAALARALGAARASEPARADRAN